MSQQITLKFLTSATQQPFKDEVVSRDFSTISNVYNTFIAECVEKGLDVAKSAKIGNAIVSKISDGTEVHIIPEPIH